MGEVKFKEWIHCFLYDDTFIVSENESYR